MNNIEILNKAIDKAENNGYDRNDEILSKVLAGHSKTYDLSIIFSHSFAKAFFKPTQKQIDNFEVSEVEDSDTNEISFYIVNRNSIDKRYLFKDDLGDIVGEEIEYWKFHFLRMALEEEPLKYLEKFL